MRNRSLIVLFALLLLLLPSQAQADGVEFKCAPGSFIVTLPAGSTIPEVSVNPVKTAVGTVNSYIYAVDAGRAAYLVTYADYPSSDVDPVKVLKGARDGELGEGNPPETEKSFMAGEFPAIYLTFAKNQGATKYYFRSLLILRNQRIYQVIYLSSEKSDRDQPVVGKFFDSFKLL